MDYDIQSPSSRPQTANLHIQLRGSTPTSARGKRPVSGNMAIRPKTSQSPIHRRAAFATTPGIRPMSRSGSTGSPIHAQGINVEETHKLLHVPSYIFNKSTSRYYIYIYI